MYVRVGLNSNVDGSIFFFFQAEDGIRDLVRSRRLGDVYKRQPYGTFDALRVMTTIGERDSIYIDSLGIGFNTPVVTTKEYKWLGLSQGVPLLQINTCLLYTSPSPRDRTRSRMPSSA